MRSDDLDPAAAFTALEPPPNGLAALRARLQREGRGRPPRVRLLFLGAVAAALVLVWIGLPPRERPASRLMDGAREAHYPSLAVRGLAALPSEPVTLLAGAGGRPIRLRRVPVASPKIVFYLAGPD
jgi:hypothetical protein